MENQIVWVDIPVANLDRAIKFYSAILAAEVEKKEFDHFRFGLLPYAQTGVSGCLVESPADEITGKGALIYFNTEGRLDDAIYQAKKFNVEIAEEKFSMGEHGFRAVLFDSEGNKIALHSLS
jgi:predicted enzyme related to lactoylglutathione lyase